MTVTALMIFVLISQVLIGGYLLYSSTPSSVKRASAMPTCAPTIDRCITDLESRLRDSGSSESGAQARALALSAGRRPDDQAGARRPRADFHRRGFLQSQREQCAREGADHRHVHGRLQPVAGRPACRRAAGRPAPPTTSPTPTISPSEVATYFAGIVSDGIVAMKSGNTPLADQPMKIDDARARPPIRCSSAPRAGRSRRSARTR